MGNRSAAILDVRSQTVTAVVGAAGVNHTFVFRGSCTRGYDGYEEGRFYSEDNLKEAVVSAFSVAEGSANEHLRTVYVGVPGEFMRVVTKTHMIGLSSPRRICAADIETLCKDGYGSVEADGYDEIEAAALYFITSDGRKVSDPRGIVSSTLQGNISYMLVSCYFLSLLKRILTEYGFKKVRFLPSPYVQAEYLLDVDYRIGGAFLLDVGALSSTVCAVYGNGVYKQKTFWAGEGQIAALVYGETGMSFEEAASLVKNFNLYRGANAKDDKEKTVSLDRLSEIVKKGLDGICEPLSAFLDECPAFSSRPILLTGEGITGIRGVEEHISGRVSRDVNVVAPELPYYNKPSMTSRIALLHRALEEEKKNGFFRRIFGK